MWKMSNELVSVVMTVYKENKEELKKSLESIINQSYKNLEIIIVIDNPDDDWREQFIGQYKDKRVILLKNEKNMGLPQSLNKALSFAKGSYIARMDADDRSHLDRIKKQVSYIKKYRFDLVGSYVTYSYRGRVQEIVKFPSNPDNIKKFLKYKSAAMHPTWLATPELFKKLNGYRDIFAVEDYDLLVRAAMNGYRISNLPEVLYDISLSEESISRSNPGKQELIAEYIRELYKKGISPREIDIERFIDSPSFNKKVEEYNKYCSLKDKRARSRDKKSLQYYVKSLELLLNVRHSFKDICKRIMTKKIMSKDKIPEAV